MSKLYAILIRKPDLEFIALLNNGVAPAVEEEKKTYFIFDSTPDSDFVPQIITELEMYETYNIYAFGSFALRPKN